MTFEEQDSQTVLDVLEARDDATSFNLRAAKRQRPQADDDEQDYNEEEEEDEKDDEDLPSPTPRKNRINWKARRCSKCNTKQTSCWRREISTNATLCNSCGLMSRENHNSQIKQDEEDEEDEESDTSSSSKNRKRRRQSTNNNASHRRKAVSSPENHVDGMVCDHCGTTSSPVWRRKEDSEKRAHLCNACGIYFKNTQRMRPWYLLARALRKSQKESPDSNEESAAPIKKEKSSSVRSKSSTHHHDRLKQPKIEDIVVPEISEDTEEVTLAQQRCSSTQSIQTLPLDNCDLISQQCLSDDSEDNDLDLELTSMLSGDDLDTKSSLPSSKSFSNTSTQQHVVENYATDLYLQQPLSPQSMDSDSSTPSLSFSDPFDPVDGLSLASVPSNAIPLDLYWFCTHSKMPRSESNDWYNDTTTPSDIFFDPSANVDNFHSLTCSSPLTSEYSTPSSQSNSPCSSFFTSMPFKQATPLAIQEIGMPQVVPTLTTATAPGFKKQLMRSFGISSPLSSPPTPLIMAYHHQQPQQQSAQPRLVDINAVNVFSNSRV